MSSDASKNEPKDRLIILRLALAGGEVRNADFQPTLVAADRNRLLRAGLLSAENRKLPGASRASLVLALTDAGWAWLDDRLDGDLPARAQVVRPLRLLLAAIKRHLDRTEFALADFLRLPAEPRSAARTPSKPEPTPAPKPDAAPSPAAPDVDVDVEDRIRRAYLRIAEGRPNVRVRLADLREALPDLPRESVDAALLRLADRGAAALYPIENPLDVRPEDQAAALRASTGHPRHILYLEDAPR